MLLDAYSEHERSDWVFHVSYILALLSPSLSFAPLPTSPPFQVRPDEEILFRGDLFKQGHVIHSWTHRHFELTRTVLRYYDGCSVKGTVTLLDATLTDLADGAAAASSSSPNRNSSHNKEASLEFSITSRSGYLLKMRAPSQVAKEEWLEAISSAVALAGNPSLSVSSLRASMRSSSIEVEGSEQVLEGQTGESASSALRRRSTVTPSTSTPNTATASSPSSSKDLLWLLMLSLAVLLVACLAAANKAGLIRFLR